MKASSDRELKRTGGQADAEEVIRERILFALGLTRRPLRSAELARALGLGLKQSGTACRWLAQHGLIHVAAKSNGDDPESAWSLSGEESRHLQRGHAT